MVKGVAKAHLRNGSVGGDGGDAARVLAPLEHHVALVTPRLAPAVAHDPVLVVLVVPHQLQTTTADRQAAQT